MKHYIRNTIQKSLLTTAMKTFGTPRRADDRPQGRATILQRRAHSGVDACLRGLEQFKSVDKTSPQLCSSLACSSNRLKDMHVIPRVSNICFSSHPSDSRAARRRGETRCCWCWSVRGTRYKSPWREDDLHQNPSIRNSNHNVRSMHRTVAHKKVVFPLLYNIIETYGKL
jgi:hypothetical protein